MFRSREKNEHICGGVACTGKSSDKKNCDRFADLKMENDVCQQNFFNSTEEIERLKKKLCQNVLCRNGGTCQEGDCICPDGFRVYSSASRNSIPSRNFQLRVEISTQNFSSPKTG